MKAFETNNNHLANADGLMSFHTHILCYCL